MAAHVLAELRALPEAELIARHDAIARNTDTPGVNYYLAELARRDGERVNQRMLELTSHVKQMTIAILALTAINVVLVAIQVALVA